MISKYDFDISERFYCSNNEREVIAFFSVTKKISRTYKCLRKPFCSEFCVSDLKIIQPQILIQFINTLCIRSVL